MSGCTPCAIRKDLTAVGTILRELLVHHVAADAVGVALDLELQAGIGLKDSGDLGEADLGVGLQRVFAGVEEHVGHVDDEAAGGLAGGQHAVQLAAQPLADGVGVLGALIGLGGTGAGLGGLGVGLCLGGLGALGLKLRLLGLHLRLLRLQLRLLGCHLRLLGGALRRSTGARRPFCAG